MPAPSSRPSREASHRTTIALLTVASAWGGAERHSAELATALAARGHRVYIFELGTPVFGGFGALDHGVELRTIRTARGVKRTTTHEWRKLLAKVTPEIVILAKGTVTVGSFALDRAASADGRTYLTIEHCVPPATPRLVTRRAGGRIPWLNTEWLRRPLRYRARAAFPDRIVCVSDAVRTALVDGYGFPSDRTVLVRNGTDTVRFAPDDEARRRTRDTWGIPDSATVIGAVARFNRVKALDDLVRAFAAVRHRQPERDARLVLIGAGPDEARLRDVVAVAGLDSVVLFPGATTTPWRIYPALDVFALTSHVEGLPLSLLEAMASGVLPVSYAVGGVPEVITSDSFGFVVPMQDLDAFTRALEAAMMMSPAHRKACGFAARERVRDAFDATRSIGRLCEVIEAAYAARTREPRATRI